MLVEFTIGNFKSFRDKTTFSMIAANLTSEDPTLDQNNVISVGKDLRLLKTAALYGANASGKSNLGVALRFMRDYVQVSAQEAIIPTTAGLEPFLLDRERREQPSFFEMIFLIDGRQFRYGFEVDRTHVVSEWLFHVPKTKEVALFLREGQEIEVKAGFKEGKGLEVRTRPEALFLSLVALFNGQTAQSVQGFFQDLAVENGLQDETFREFTLKCLRDPEKKKAILSFVQTLDLDIENVFAANPPAISDLPSVVPDESRQHFVQDIEKFIFTVHRFGDEARDFALFDMDQNESQGTRKLIAMAGPLWSILEYGLTMFIDELDARLHPLMTRRIIELFHSPLTNLKGAQLIFATHDTNLLDKNLFRRDQIWFTEKDAQGVTHLASLAEYRGVRNGAAYEKNYLEGRYGAIPFLGDLDRLPWTRTAEGGSEEAERELTHA